MRPLSSALPAAEATQFREQVVKALGYFRAKLDAANGGSFAVEDDGTVLVVAVGEKADAVRRAAEAAGLVIERARMPVVS